MPRLLLWIAGLLTTCCLDTALQAQRVTFREEPAVKQMMDRFVNRNKTAIKVNGWRIQFYATTDRRNMENTIRKLKKQYPDVKFTWTFNDPYYQVRAGAYTTRQEAVPLQYALKREFPGAFPVTEEIEVKELLENQ